jgi:hypothetical protein
LKVESTAPGVFANAEPGLNALLKVTSATSMAKAEKAQVDHFLRLGAIFVTLKG